MDYARVIDTECLDQLARCAYCECTVRVTDSFPKDADEHGFKTE